MCGRLENGQSLLDGNGIGGIESDQFLDGSDSVVATPALANETTSLVETPLKLAEVNERLSGFFAELAGVFKGCWQEQLSSRKPMNLERSTCSHHGGPRREWRAGRDSRPCRLGPVDTAEGQLTRTEFVLNFAVSRPSGRQPGQPGQGRGRFPIGQRRGCLLPVGPQPPDIECPESPTCGKDSEPR